MAEDYQYLPTEALDLEQRTDQADQWAAQQRRQLADLWANAQREAVQPLAEAQVQQQAQPEAPSSTDALTSSPLPGGFTSQGTAAAAADMGLSTEPRDLAPPQFGNHELSAEQAYAACGPVAAVAFARAYGRNPSVTEAMALARRVGWTVSGGMNGVANQKALLDSMGVGSRLDTNPDPAAITQDVENGNPVIISTPNHYFIAQAVRHEEGRTEFFVGNTGANALRGGKPWMSLEEMQARMGTVNGALFVDHPLAHGPSSTERPGSPIATAQDLQQAVPLASALPNAPSWFDQARQGFTPDPGALSGLPRMPQPGEQPMRQFGSLGEALAAAAQEATNRRKPLLGPGGLGMYDPNLGPPGESGSEAEQRAGVATLEDVGRASGEGLPGQAAPTAEQAARQAGQINPALALHAGGAAAGGAVGYATTPEGASPEERAGRTLIGAAGGLALSGLARYGLERLGPQASQDAEHATQQAGRTTRLERIPATVEVPSGLPRPLKTAEAVPGQQAIELSTAEQIARLRLDKFPEEVRPAVQDSAERVNFAQAQRRGVIPDAAAEAMADTLAHDTTYDDWMRQGAAGKAYNTEQIRAIRNASAAQAATVDQLARQIQAGDDSSASLSRFFAEAGKLDQLTTLREGARAEAGRALRAWIDPARLVDLSPNDAVARIAKALGGDRSRLLEVVNEYRGLVDNGAGPIQLAQFWSRLTQPPPGIADWFRLLRYNSLVSGARTIDAIAIHGSTQVLWNLAKDTGGSLASGRPEELPAELHGLWLGVQRGSTNFMQTLAHGFTEERAASGDLPTALSARLANPVAKGTAIALEAPMRLHAAMQDFTQQTGYYMRLYRDAAEQASKEGLRERMWSERVAELVGQPSDAMTADAGQFGAHIAARGEMGQLGQWVAQLQRMPIIGPILAPFVRIPYNLASAGINVTPAGALGTLADVARTGGKYLGATANQTEKLGLKGVATFRERAVNNLVGSAIFLWLYDQARRGNITASGPTDPQTRATMEAQGWQRSSFRIGDTWRGYSNLGMLAIPLASVAALAESDIYAKKDATLGDRALDTVHRLGEVVTDHTLLRDFIDGVARPLLERSGKPLLREAGNIAEGLIPYGAAISTYAQSQDPYQRESPRDIGQAVESRLPGLREQLPVAEDVLGRQRANPYQGAMALQPFQTSQQRDDPIVRALLDNGVSVPAPPTTITERGSKGAIQLTPDEQREYRELAGERLQYTVGEYLQSSSYQKQAMQVRQQRLRELLKEAHERASYEVLRRMPPTERRDRQQQGLEHQVRQPVPALQR